MTIQIEEAFIYSYLVAIVYLVIVCGTSRCEIQLFHELCSGCRPTVTEIAQNLISSFRFSFVYSQSCKKIRNATEIPNLPVVGPANHVLHLGG